MKVLLAEQFLFISTLIVPLILNVCNSVPDPDPRVFWPPGSGSTSQRYGSGSGSGSDPSIIMQKSYYFVTLFDFLSLKYNVNVPTFKK
jgi:hypothetical protein